MNGSRPSDEPAYQPDDVDREIVTLLLADGRASAATIARKLCVSERRVRYRIERLVRAGVISLGAVVDPHAVGYEVIADLFLEIRPGRVRAVAERFAELDEVSYVAGSIGNGDLSIQVCLRDMAELTRFVDEVVGAMPEVLHARMVLVPWKLKDVYEWNLPIATPDQRPGS